MSSLLEVTDLFCSQALLPTLKNVPEIAPLDLVSDHAHISLNKDHWFK